MKFGVAYYPEHWSEDRWHEDARLIRQAGMDIVRVGEFAWSSMEPRRGQYDLDWLERAINICGDEGLKVIVGTPTAAPPLWLFARHPSMSACDREGKEWFAGSRRTACLNNRPYRRYVRRIVREMARRLARNAHVMGWQVDNELGCHASGACYCNDCEQGFREWLHRRYGTIERLNKLWGTVFWSQRVADWHLIKAPRRTPAGAHPSLVLDFLRFSSSSVRDFVAEQRKLIEEYSRHPVVITTNTIGLHTDRIDQFALGSVLDVVAHDSYPVATGALPHTALNLDVARSSRSAPFWVMEQQAGATLIHSERSQPRPGQLGLWTVQAVARGADMVSYFRWRTCPFGQEMYWEGLFGVDGVPSAYYSEITSVMATLKAKASMWEGRRPDARVAIVLDYAAHWVLKEGGPDMLAQLRSFHDLLREAGLAVDIVQPDDDLSGYRVAIAPMPIISRERAAGRWIEFVRSGGTMLLTAPAGTRTEQSTRVMSTVPGHYADLLGAHVSVHDRLGSGADVQIAWDAETYPAQRLLAVIETCGAETVATCVDEHYAGSPVVTRHACKRGHAWFLGAPTSRDGYARLLGAVLADAGVERHPWADETTEVIPLTADDGEPPLTFVLNHAATPVELALPPGVPHCDVLSDSEHRDALSIEGYGAVLLTWPTAT